MRSLLFLFLFLFAINGWGQIVFNGIISEPEWGSPLGTSIGGPIPCLNSGSRLNSLFASANSTNIYLGIGGNVQPGNAILVFLDTKPDGYNNGDFGREGSPPGLTNFNKNIVFDDRFLPDYCLSISTNTNRSSYSFVLHELSGTSLGGGRTLFSEFSPGNGGGLGVSTADNDHTKGFEIVLTRNLLEFNAALQSKIKLMAMIISDAGVIDNQFVNKALSSDGCYGAGALDFRNLLPDPVEFSPDQLLPITFTQFTFTQRNATLLLKWSCATETNMDHYELERSTDAINFSHIGKVIALGNNSTIFDYEFVDLLPRDGKSFYRIKAIDKAGRSAFSSVVKVQFGYVDNSLSIFPNPVADNINLQLVGLTKGKYSLVIYNDAGQRVLSKTIEYNGGYGLQTIPILPNMTAGPYRLLLTNKSVFYKQNFLVRKIR
jgi:hypothetical protein